MQPTQVERGSMGSVIEVLRSEGAACGATPLGMLYREWALGLEALRDDLPSFDEPIAELA